MLGWFTVIGDRGGNPMAIRTKDLAEPGRLSIVMAGRVPAMKEK